MNLFFLMFFSKTLQIHYIFSIRIFIFDKIQTRINLNKGLSQY